jgi:hypothetical protein
MRTGVVKWFRNNINNFNTPGRREVTRMRRIDIVCGHFAPGKDAQPPSTHQS